LYSLPNSRLKMVHSVYFFWRISKIWRHELDSFVEEHRRQIRRYKLLVAMVVTWFVVSSEEVSSVLS
jgi:hypothetical protein